MNEKHMRVHNNTQLNININMTHQTSEIEDKWDSLRNQVIP